MALTKADLAEDLFQVLGFNKQMTHPKNDVSLSKETPVCKSTILSLA